MSKYDIYVSDLALADMDGIAAYISTKFGAPDTAEGIIDSFYVALSSLADSQNGTRWLGITF